MDMAFSSRATAPLLVPLLAVLALGACAAGASPPSPEPRGDAAPSIGAVLDAGPLEEGDAAPVPDTAVADARAADAQASPSVDGAGRWIPAAGAHLQGPVAVAAAGASGALAFVETTGEGEAPRFLRVQRFDDRGAFRGPPLTWPLTRHSGAPALASDGARHVACWGEERGVQCLSAAPTDGALQPAYAVTTAAPPRFVSLVHGPRGWLLAWFIGEARGYDGTIHLQRLGARLEPLGAPRTVFTASAIFAQQLLVAATESGFAYAAGAPVRVQRLDAALAPTGAPIDLGQDPGYFGAMVATDETLVVSLSSPYEGTIFLVDAERRVTKVPLRGTYKTGVQVALLRDGPATSALWIDESTPDGRVRFEPRLDRARDPALVGPVGPWVELALLRVGRSVFAVAGSSFEIGLIPVDQR